MVWNARVTMCRWCGKHNKSPSGLTRHVKSVHCVTIYTYYQFNLDQLRARIMADIRVVMRHRPPSFTLGACWEYQGRSTGRMGYRQIRVDGAPILNAHRISFWAWTGTVPKVGELLLHQCDNPPCVRPNHLLLGTHTENMAERTHRDRVSRGSRHYNGHTEAIVQRVRRLIGLNWSHRQIAVDVKISAASVGRIARGETYQDVPYDPSQDPNFIPW